MDESTHSWTLSPVSSRSLSTNKTYQRVDILALFDGRTRRRNKRTRLRILVFGISLNAWVAEGLIFEVF